MNSPLSSVAGPIPPAASAPAASSRLVSIDALRGLVILLMLVDHTREFFYAAHPVSDPMDLATTAPDLFFTRLSAHLCAPVFVALAGTAAWLYGAGRGGARPASAFLFKRGLFLVALELTVVNFAWGFDPTPPIVYLQVIWAIGLSMIALAGLVHLPRAALIAVGAVLVLGHNLLDPIAFAPGEPGRVLWAILHDRGMIDLPLGGQARTSYPLLPWIGVIALGYAAGPWFAKAVPAPIRLRRLVTAGAAAILLCALLRGANTYGDPTPWTAAPDPLATVMSVLNLTKYPPSADFLLLTLGLGLLLLALIERVGGRVPTWLAVFGSAPLFFYLQHLYLLHALNLAVPSLPSVGWLWLLAAFVALPCWFACRSFARAKQRSGWWLMRYL
jgi:uncharacterized membrane protein